ncbi:MAG: hypothetical protein H3C35_00105 [Bacteroidetes bacterium]|nr:hypothetical protein [Bacteroidota bacterium]
MEQPNIYILQTDIESFDEKEFILMQLNRMDKVKRASLDFADRDKVLRVECLGYSLQQLMNIISNYGIGCRDLPDEK